MAAGFVGDIADQGFAPGLRFGLAGFVGRHGLCLEISIESVVYS
jgi:hypothetical protein